MKKILKNNKETILTFIVAFITINVVFIINNITPYGTFTTLQIDFYHQYGPMLKELCYRIFNGKSLLYSFSMSMGLPIYRNFFNYLSSPLNILILLFSEKTMLAGFSFIIMIRVSITAAIFNYFLEKKFNKKNKLFISLSLLYAFSNYFVAYYWNIMWMDCMALLPLIVLGIENIVNKNEYLLYIFSLSIMIISSYFMGYMCCLYSVIYFICYFIYKLDFKSLKKKKYLKEVSKKVLIFTISSIVVGLLISFFGISLLKGLSSTSATNDAWPTSQYYNFTFIDYIVGHLSAIKTTVLKTDVSNEPNVSCGIIAVALLLLFIFNNKIKLKTKITYIVILGIITTAFFIPQLDFVFHALHVPNDLPYRYSYLYSFTLMIIAAYSIENIKQIKPMIVIVVYTLIMILLLTFKIYDLEVLDSDTLLTNLILITVYFILYLIYFYDRKTIKYIYYGLILIVSIEMGYNINYNWNLLDNKDEFYSHYDEIKDTVNKLDKKENNNFYRLEKTFSTTLNDGSWYNYNGVSTFSSMEYERMAILQHNLGTGGNLINSYEYFLNTPIYNLMFDIKYILGYNYDIDNYTEIYQNDKFNTYKFNYKTNLLYGVNKEIKDIELIQNNPMLNQYNFIKYTTGVDDVFNTSKIVNKKTIDYIDGMSVIEYTIKNSNTNNYFYDNYGLEYYIINDILYYRNDYVLDLVDTSYYMSTEKHDENILVNFTNENDTYKIIVGTYYEDNNIDVFYLNKKQFEQAHDILLKDKINIQTNKESYIKAKAEIDEDKVIYTSIPYDDDLKVYIDGKKVDTYMINSALLGFDIEKGKHTIEIKYQNNTMIIGSIISVITLLSLLTIQYKKRCKK